jgi:hypothetical protein
MLAHRENERPSSYVLQKNHIARGSPVYRAETGVRKRITRFRIGGGDGVVIGNILGSTLSVEMNACRLARSLGVGYLCV